MKITRTSTLPAGVEDAFAVIATQEHQEAKLAGQSDRSSVTITKRAEGRVEVRTERELSTREMTGPVASMVGSTLTITETQRWGQPAADGSRSADLEITVSGVPVRLTGTVALAPADTGSSITVDADLTCSMPFVGKKVETASAPAIEESFDLEVTTLTERLR